ncbi:hypothetical protein L0F63_002960 [Massospora cicadina]|nr:hypothetical protein L0F63_002960 [Massospora cicadina]
MDFLSEAITAEIDKKKRQLEKVGDKLGVKKKYIRKADLEKLREEEYLAEQRRLEEERALRKKLALEEKVEKAGIDDQEKKDASTDDTEIIGTIPEEEVTRRLRAKGQPIRLFDESNRQRQLRLRALELMEERTDGQRNDFMKVLEAMDTDLQLDYLRNPVDQAEAQSDKNKSKRGSNYAEIDTTELTMEMVQNNTERAFGLLYVFFKRVLREWEFEMNNRPEEVKRTTQGKTAAAIQKQTADYMKPFFRQLKKKTIASDVLTLIAEICIRLQEREYLKANDAYLRLSIGNAPWPIGVTMVG